ncbi:MAG: 4-hydroxybenzoyl-CoA thioesterase [Bacteroidetes bacterium]|jgi:acyl-CoA thioester hydrolase|nr:4-hydroxybenzoyl-CoA thioesterase [Bacteroidota bacterium]MDF2453327.1 4-hydroxybenzoyl-CoA thioesterase [Bacteroidota bacterium]
MLRNITESVIKFSEVDSLRVVWHGHYVRYFEDGREAFGKQYGIGYLDIYEHGLAVPLVDLQVNFKRILEYGDTAVIETTFINSPAAKMIFEYKITSAKHGYIACAGKTTQVFMSPQKKELFITMPPFMEAWKKRWEI